MLMKRFQKMEPDSELSTARITPLQTPLNRNKGLKKTKGGVDNCMDIILIPREKVLKVQLYLLSN